MKTLQIDVPKFSSHNRVIRKQIHVTNSQIRDVLERLSREPAKCVSIDLGLAISTIYRINHHYVLKDGVLYRRVKDGNK